MEALPKAGAVSPWGATKAPTLHRRRGHGAVGGVYYIYLLHQNALKTFKNCVHLFFSKHFWWYFHIFPDCNNNKITFEWWSFEISACPCQDALPSVEGRSRHFQWHRHCCSVSDISAGEQTLEKAKGFLLRLVFCGVLQVARESFPCVDGIAIILFPSKSMKNLIEFVILVYHVYQPSIDQGLVTFVSGQKCSSHGQPQMCWELREHL